ncbi:monothiol glutaredoxin, Grx4 family, partial [Francisella tularensis subsp. holarctica]|nr:monothiol glutaredoxin, Grx4 family [Francisella tularensis subsp. holarctica]
PKLWVKGELIGGCDIIMEMNESVELKKLIDSVK